jgi:hypothetical protein
MIVFLSGIAAAVCLGLGWVLQQQVAAHAALSELLSFRLLLHLMRKRVWWVGIGAMITGQALGALALSAGSLSLVEPLLSTNLLFAFIIAASMRRSLQWTELVGAVLLSASLGVFISVGNPRATEDGLPPLVTSVLAVCLVAGIAAVLVLGGRGRGLVTESILFATAAGVLYGLQDAGTRAALLGIERHGVASLLVSPWAYVVVLSAAVGILLSQSAFRAARLDYSLPPTAVAEPVIGIALGVGVLGDALMVSPGRLAVEFACLAGMVAGTVIIGRSGTMTHHAHRHLLHISSGGERERD